MTVARGTIAAALVGMILAGLATASSADEARVLRIGVPGALHSILYYHDSLPATQLLTHAVFDTLIAYEWKSLFGPFTTDPATLEPRKT